MCIRDRHRAIELSKNSVKTGGGPFGAVIAKDGIIIAEASNSVTTVSYTHLDVYKRQLLEYGFIPF